MQRRACIQPGSRCVKDHPVQRHLSLLIGLAMAGMLAPPTLFANCVTSGNTTTCDTGSPNPWTTVIGQGPNTASGATVNVNANAQVSVGNGNAISLGNNAIITLDQNALVQNSATSGAGLWSAGNNTVEFGSNGTLTIAQGAAIRAIGSQGNGEAINVMGSGNRITNRGTIATNSGAAIWFEDRSVGAANVVDNYGVIQTGRKQGMQLMDDAIASLFQQGLVTAEEAYYRSENKQVMRQVLGIH